MFVEFYEKNAAKKIEVDIKFAVTVRFINHATNEICIFVSYSRAPASLLGVKKGDASTLCVFELNEEQQIALGIQEYHTYILRGYDGKFWLVVLIYIDNSVYNIPFPLDLALMS